MKFVLLSLTLLISSVSFSQVLTPDCSEPASRQSAAEKKIASDILIQIKRSMLLSGAEVYENSSDLKSWFIAADQTNVRFVDSDLPAEVNEVVQQGTAYSCENLKTGEMFTFLNRTLWSRLTEPADQEALIHHEIAVLAGLESTGNYAFTQKFVQARKNSYIARYALDSLVCQLTLFEKSSNGSADKPIAQKEIRIKPQSSVETVQLMGRKNRQGIYARVVGNAGSIVTINLIEGTGVQGGVSGRDLLKQNLKSYEDIKEYVLHGYTKNFSGDFSKFFDADPYLFQVTCKSVPNPDLQIAQ